MRCLATRPRRLAAFLAALLLLAGAGIAWLIGTERGLHGMIWMLARIPGVQMRTTGAHGSLLGGVTIEHLVIEHERATIDIEGLATHLEPSALPVGLLQLSYLTAARVAVTLKARRRPPDATSIAFLPHLLRIHSASVRVAAVTVTASDSLSFAMRDLRLAALLSRSRLRVADLHVGGDGWGAAGEGALTGGRDLGLEGVAHVDAVHTAGVAVDLKTEGTLGALDFDALTRVPQGARAKGQLHLSDRLAVKARLMFDRLDPTAIWSSAEVGPLTGDMEIAGWLDRFNVIGRVSTGRLPKVPVEITADAGLAGHVLTLDRLTAVLATGAGARRPQLTASGRVEFRDAPRISLSAHWTDLRWPLATGQAVIDSPEGMLVLDGVGPFGYRINSRVNAEATPPATVLARGKVRRGGLSVESLEIDVAGGKITGRADLELTAQQRWSLGLDARGLDPGTVREPLRGRINASLQGEGEGYGLVRKLDVRLERLDGTVRGLPASGSGRVALHDEQWRFDDLKLVFGSARASANGGVGLHTQFAWQSRIDRLGDFVPGAGGSVRSQGVVSGNGGQRAVRGSLVGRDLIYAGMRAAQLSADVDLDASDARPSRVNALAADLVYGSYRAEQLRLTLDGLARAHSLVVHLQQGRTSADLSGHGLYQPGVWRMALERFQVAGPTLWSYRLAAPSALAFSAGTLSVTSTCFIREDSRICADGSWSTEQPWAFSIEANSLPVKLAAFRMPANFDYAGTANLATHVYGAPAQPWTGDTTVDLANAEFRYKTVSGRTEVARLGTGRLGVVSRPDNHVASLGFATLGGSFVTATLAIGRKEFSSMNAPLDGDVSLATTEFGWLPVIVPSVDRFAGKVAGQAHIGGTLGAPLLEGSAHLTGGEIDVYRTNLLLRAIDATLSIGGDSLALVSSAETRGGTASANGQLTWHDRAPSGRLEFKGENLLVANLPEARVVASPQLLFTVAKDRIAVSGDVKVPSARLAPRDMRNAVLRSGDEWILGETSPDTTGDFQVDASLRLVLGDDVSIDAYGLNGQLDGSLSISARGDEVAAGTGEISIRDGKYTVYTRELDIERGRLLFAGQSLGDPGVDIRAQRKLQSVTAGVNVRGTLLVPQISFYSDPALSQSQIAAILILGRTLDDIQDTTTSSSTLAAQGGALLGAQLGRYVGVGDVGVEQDVNKGSSVVIGKFLSPRLYVSYGVSLAEAINTLKLRYSIGDRWVIRTETGARQSVDIEYTIGR